MIKDQFIRLSSTQSAQKYTKLLSLITYHDLIHDKEYEFVSNIMHLSAATIALIYKHRWQIELFFKWVKQNLVIKTFFGTNQNAVFSQVWVALIYHPLLQYIMAQVHYAGSMRSLASVINEKLFERCSLIDILSLKSQSEQKPPEDNQISLPGDLY